MLCRGSFNDFSNPNDDSPGGVWVIDPTINAIVDSLVLTPGIHPTELTLDNNGRGYFLTGTAIAQYDTDTVTMVNDSYIPGNFYHVQYDSLRGQLYALDAKDFVVPGEMIVFGATANEIGRYTVGVIPGYIGFISDEE